MSKCCIKPEKERFSSKASRQPRSRNSLGRLTETLTEQIDFDFMVNFYTPFNRCFKRNQLEAVHLLFFANAV